MAEWNKTFDVCKSPAGSVDRSAKKLSVFILTHPPPYITFSFETASACVFEWALFSSSPHFWLHWFANVLVYLAQKILQLADAHLRKFVESIDTMHTVGLHYLLAICKKNNLL